jgi:hypothetical protein
MTPRRVAYSPVTGVHRAQRGGPGDRVVHGTGADPATATTEMIQDGTATGQRPAGSGHARAAPSAPASRVMVSRVAWSRM